MPSTTFVTCDECGDDYADDDGFIRMRDCGCCYVCDNCDNGYDSSDDDDDYGNGSVRAWNYRPSPYMPKGNYPAEPLLGLELEIGGRASDIVQAVHAVDDTEHHLYMKEDGSISGVEIVTHPMTLDYAHSFDFDRLMRELNWAGSYVDDGYGVHVHVSRNAFRRNGARSSSHAMAWLMFIYRNSTEVQAIARRSNSRWARFTAPRPGELVNKSAEYPVSDDRYIAVNCLNAKTYELRFFASTLSAVELYSALEFADASVEYTRGIKTADVLRGTALSWNHFARFVAANADRYSRLHSEIVRLAPDTGVDDTIVKTRPQPRNAGLLRRTALRRAGDGGAIRTDAGNGNVFTVQVRDGADFYMRNEDSHGAFGDDFYSDEFFRHDGWAVVRVGDTSNVF